MKNLGLYLAVLFTLVSCSNFIEFIDSNSNEMKIDGKSLSLLFSHNINGETHPCGCRHFPLGGLPQVAGQFEKLRKSGQQIMYVDTGDTFFPSSTLPSSVQKSLSFGATNLGKGLGELGLSYFVPGDQDFAAGVEFLKALAVKSDIDFLTSNLTSSDSLPHKPWVKLISGKQKIFLVGVVWRQTLSPNYAGLFQDPLSAFPGILSQLKSEGYSSKNENHRLIVLSHGGIDNDIKLAEKFSQIDWIIGSHSQSFTQKPTEVGSTRIVQVLSRNHYLGEIRLDLTVGKKNDKFMIHEVRDELKDELKPNPWLEFIDGHKEQLTKIQAEEQSAFANNVDDSVPYRSAVSCIECHSDQGDHWQKTPHALAYVTLINVKEQNNMTCIKCHSVGAGEQKGFKRAIDMVRIDEETIEKAKQEAHKKKYWEAVKKQFASIKSVRELGPEKIKSHSQKWMAMDEKHGVTHNFANVQCLNCHDQVDDHPFVVGEKLDQGKRYESIKNKCLSCHTTDQSPQWYRKNTAGLPSDLDEVKFVELFKSIGCPKLN